jgi:hypothetical protein
MTDATYVLHLHLKSHHNFQNAPSKLLLYDNYYSPVLLRSSSRSENWLICIRLPWRTKSLIMQNLELQHLRAPPCNRKRPLMQHSHRVKTLLHKIPQRPEQRQMKRSGLPGSNLLSLWPPSPWQPFLCCWMCRLLPQSVPISSSP